MFIKTLHLTHLPPDLAVQIALFQDVENASFLRQQLLSGNKEFEYALIDASAVCCVILSDAIPILIYTDNVDYTFAGSCV